MAKFNDLLHLRFRQKQAKEPKMTALVERANNGDLSSFSGVFRVAPLSEQERDTLTEILEEHRSDETHDIQSDLALLTILTSEVKAITNQAVMLHGERIKRAQEALKKYRDGAFTAWLFATYGNRQTPYNFLQYYEFYTMMPQTLHPIIDQMPRQAVYALASRQGTQETKEDVVRNYTGQTKKELLQLIRIQFPVAEEGRHAVRLSTYTLKFLKRARDTLRSKFCTPTEGDKAEMQQILDQIQKYINQ